MDLDNTIDKIVNKMLDIDEIVELKKTEATKIKNELNEIFKKFASFFVSKEVNKAEIRPSKVDFAETAGRSDFDECDAPIITLAIDKDQLYIDVDYNKKGEIKCYVYYIKHYPSMDHLTPPEEEIIYLNEEKYISRSYIITYVIGVWMSRLISIAIEELGYDKMEIGSILDDE